MKTTQTHRTNQEVDLTKACVFLRLSLSRMGDKKGVSSDLVQADVDKTMVMVRKRLFRCHQFNAIKNLDSQIRNYVRDPNVCLPFDPGIHMVALQKADEIDRQLEIYFQARVMLIDEFAKAWPNLVKNLAPKDLRALYEKNDYEMDGIRDEFLMTWNFWTFTAPLELKEVSPRVFKAESERIRQRMDDAFDKVRLVQAETFAQLVGQLRDKLSGDVNGNPKRLSASKVRDLIEFTRSFPLQNVTNFEQLATEVDRADRLLKGVDIEELRSTDGLRARVRSELSEIEQILDRNIVNAPRRIIRRG
jgi:hypothetical protein